MLLDIIYHMSEFLSLIPMSIILLWLPRASSLLWSAARRLLGIRSPPPPPPPPHLVVPMPLRSFARLPTTTAISQDAVSECRQCADTAQMCARGPFIRRCVPSNHKTDFSTPVRPTAQAMLAGESGEGKPWPSILPPRPTPNSQPN